jgi:hypothetical protein
MKLIKIKFILLFMILIHKNECKINIPNDINIDDDC